MKIGSSVGDGIRKLFSSELKVIIVGQKDWDQKGFVHQAFGLVVQGKIPPHLAEIRIPSALPKQCVRVCSVDCYRQIKKKYNKHVSMFSGGVGREKRKGMRYQLLNEFLSITREILLL